MSAFRYQCISNFADRPKLIAARPLRISPHPCGVMASDFVSEFYLHLVIYLLALPSHLIFVRSINDFEGFIQT